MQRANQGSGTVLLKAREQVRLYCKGLERHGSIRRVKCIEALGIRAQSSEEPKCTESFGFGFSWLQEHWVKGLGTRDSVIRLDLVRV